MALLSMAAPALALVLLAVRSPEAFGCTLLAIDGGASRNGAAYAVENTDADGGDTRLNFVSAKDHPKGAMRPVFHLEDSYPRWVGYGRGALYHPELGQKLSVPFAHIPEVPHTHGYYESDNALMNDQGLGVGESSCSTNLLNRVAGNSNDTRSVPSGILDAMTLMQLALERCASARCAVETISSLVEEFGYLPDGGEGMIASAAAGKPPAGNDAAAGGRRAWGDVGEAYAFADASGEAWMMHVMGGVEGVLRSVWVAQKVPKGHLAVVANEFTIGDLPSEPNDHFLFPKEIFHAAVVAGLWNGKGAFHWTRVFAPDPIMFHGVAGTAPIPSYSSLRRWRLSSIANPSLGLEYEHDQRAYPFSIPFDHKIVHRDVMDMMSDHYSGTEFDLTQGVLAGPFSSPFRVGGGPSFGDTPRAIFLQETMYSIITETGPQGSVAWFATDTPATSVWVPLDSRAGTVAPIYQKGSSQKFTRDSAWWAFDFVNNWMQLMYKGMSEGDVLPRRKAWQDHIDEERLKPKDAQELGEWQVAMQERLVADWWELSDMLIAKFNDMRNRAGSAPFSGAPVSGGYPDWYANMIGFNHDIHPVWVERASAAPAGCNAVPPTVKFARDWSLAKGWYDKGEVPQTLLQRVSDDEVATSRLWGPLGSVVTMLCIFFLGSIFGVLVSRRPAPKGQPLLS